MSWIVKRNEITDIFAKTRIPFVGPDPFFGISGSVILKKLKSKVDQRKYKYRANLHD